MDCSIILGIGGIAVCNFVGFLAQLSRAVQLSTIRKFYSPSNPPPPPPPPPNCGAYFEVLVDRLKNRDGIGLSGGNREWLPADSTVEIARTRTAVVEDRLNSC